MKPLRFLSWDLRRAEYILSFSNIRPVLRLAEDLSIRKILMRCPKTTTMDVSPRDPDPPTRRVQASRLT